MTISVFNLFSIGVGPSSSHTVGPMRAACAFSDHLIARSLQSHIERLTVELFGSLAFTGKGHGTDGAILMGLEGALPESVDPDTIQPRTTAIIETQQLQIAGKHTIPFHYTNDFI